MNNSEKFVWVGGELPESMVAGKKQEILEALNSSPGAKKLPAEELAKMVDNIYLLIKKFHEEDTAEKKAA